MTICIIDIPQFIHFDADYPKRFENHVLSGSFSKNLLIEIGEIKQKIKNFQEVNNVIEGAHSEHPLLELNENRAKVNVIGKAIKTELTFFKKLQSQSPMVQAQLLEMKYDQNHSLNSLSG
ncbi:MAG: hypothetical protein H0U75_04365 [Legionella sp.]|nr:hypothetical protein [Legionella sp.]